MKQEAGPALEVRGIARRFGRRWPLRGVSLRIEPGEAVALTGRNGSGKTTLVRILATVLRPTRGGGTIFGTDLVRERDAVRRWVGLLGHQPGLYPDLTAEENLRFAQKMLGLERDPEAIRTALASVGLGREADSRVRNFSAGMQRRLALARLLLRPPRLLLLDEPYASFDTEGVKRINEFVQTIKGRGGAVVIATHTLPRALPYVERVVHLENGRLAEQWRGEAGTEDAAALHPAAGADTTARAVGEGGR